MIEAREAVRIAGVNARGACLCDSSPCTACCDMENATFALVQALEAQLTRANAENDDLKRQRALAWHQNVCPPCVEGDHANCTGACDSSCCAVADLETELEMSEQALARANAVIERVGAWENEHADACDLEHEAWAELRTILKGADNE